MLSFFRSFRKKETRKADSDSCPFHAGSSSGGAEDPYVCRVAGGEDGCDGEEEEVNSSYVLRMGGMKNRQEGVRSWFVGYRGKLWYIGSHLGEIIGALHLSTQAIPFKSTGRVFRRRTVLSRQTEASCTTVSSQ